MSSQTKKKKVLMVNSMLHEISGYSDKSFQHGRRLHLINQKAISFSGSDIEEHEDMNSQRDQSHIQGICASKTALLFLIPLNIILYSYY